MIRIVVPDLLSRVGGPAAVLALLTVPMVLVAAVPPGAAVQAREAGRTLQYGQSTAPFWKVGEPDPALTRLCRRGRFNQLANNSYYIGYYGGANPGRGYTGIAKRGYNLRDPEGRAVAGFTYHFFNDGYSNCKVYAAPDPEPPPARP